jgi:hypothetical protein
MTTVQEVQTIAKQERQRLARQMGYIQTKAAMDAGIAERAVERQAGEAAARVQQQRQAARAQAEQETGIRKGEIRKQMGAAEKQAQAAMGRARESQAREARKQVLPFTRPQTLGIGSYIASVESARQQAHRTGRDATAAVTRVRDDYFKEVDQAEARAIADISKQQEGIVKGIRQQLASYSADLTKQLANLNSGVDAWESDAKTAINKAQDDYEAAIRAQLDRPGTDVFADMQGQGLVPANAIYKDYDKTTGQLNYTIPDTRDGQEIFAAEQAAGNIPGDATYKDYDRASGQLSYTVPNKAKTQTATNTTAPAGPQSTNVVGKAAGVALAGAAVMTMTQAGAGIAAIPTPPTWAIGGTILVAALIIGLIERERIARGIKQLVGNREQGASSAVITNDSGSIAYSTAQISVTSQAKGGNILVDPWLTHEKGENILVDPWITQAKGSNILADPWVTQAKGSNILVQPWIKPDTGNVIIRDPFDVPEMRQKGSNIYYAAAALQTAANGFTRTAQRELSISREESERLFAQVNEYLRQGRVREGQRILNDMAKEQGQVSVSEPMRAAYQEYLRKKAILDAARKSYVASLNPQPIKGKGSLKAKAAAAGVWLIQDILQDSIQKSLARGETLKSAMEDAQAKAARVTKELGLTQQQVTAANTTVVYDTALATMTQQAIQTATQGRTQGLTDTELQTRVFNATKTAAQTVTQTAVQTNTLTQTQAQSMTNELTRTAEAVTELTMRIKLEKFPAKEAAKKGDDEYPDGSIVWRMGSLRGRNGEYKIIPPPYTMKKPITSPTPPKGMVKTKGTPQQTLTFLGGKVPFSNVSFDLGVTDGFIDVKSRTIKFAGHGEKTDVGTRIPGPTTGVELADNTPLLQQLAKKPQITRGPGMALARQPLRVTSQARPVDSSTLSTAVYSDRKGERLARKHHRGWKRVY